VPDPSRRGRTATGTRRARTRREAKPAPGSAAFRVSSADSGARFPAIATNSSKIASRRAIARRSAATAALGWSAAFALRRSASFAATSPACRPQETGARSSSAVRASLPGRSSG
jgi:hypothetical protein